MTNETMNNVMLECIKIARKNLENDQYPIAAVITDDTGRIIVSSQSSLRQHHDPTNHPAMEVIRKAAVILKQRKLTGYYLFTTLEPCPMCTSAAVWACLDGIIYGSHQDDAIAFVKNNPEHKLSWRQIPIRAEYILENAHPKPKLFGGIQRELCNKLFK